MTGTVDPVVRHERRRDRSGIDGRTKADVDEDELPLTPFSDWGVRKRAT